MMLGEPPSVTRAYIQIWGIPALQWPPGLWLTPGGLSHDLAASDGVLLRPDELHHSDGNEAV